MEDDTSVLSNLLMSLHLIKFWPPLLADIITTAVSDNFFIPFEQLAIDYSIGTP